MSPRLIHPALALTAVLAFSSTSHAAFAWTSTTPLGTGTGSGTASGYWDNTSMDGADANIGYLLTRSSTYYTNPLSPGYYAGPALISPGALHYDPSAAAGFSLSRTPPTAGSTSLQAEVAGNAVGNEFWVFSGGTYTRLFAGGQTGTPGAGGNPVASLLTVGNPFVLILVDTINDQAFFSTGATYYNFSFSGVGGGGSTATGIDGSSIYNGFKQNFALFRSGGTGPTTELFVGIEDLRHGDRDYNDMVIRLSIEPNGPDEFDLEPAPAPAGLVLALFGIVPCVALRRRLLGTKAAE